MELLSSLPENLKLIAITGGPGGGKTEGMDDLAAGLQSDGYRVLRAPEVARSLKAGGIDFADPVLGGEAFQALVLEGSLHRDAMYVAAGKRLAEAGHKVVVLFDRGCPEGEAYVAASRRPAFAEMARRLSGGPLGDLCEGRYHAVVHLVTAAEGAEAHYRTDAERHESPAEARFLDGATLSTWLRHPHLRVIDNRTDFAGKKARLIREVRAVLGEPVPLETEDKYLVRVKRDGIPEPHATSLIVQDYLDERGDGSEVRVRRRTHEGYSLFYRTEKRPAGPRTRLESERVISKDDYDALYRSRSPARRQIRKLRHCFVWAGRFFELDNFLEPKSLHWVLEIERLAHESKDGIELPPFLEIVADVSEDPRFSNGALSRTGAFPEI